MAEYRVSIKPSAAKEIDELPLAIGLRVELKIAALAGNQRPAGVKKLKGAALWRIRVGDYRVLYSIDDQQRVVDIIRVRHRRKAYD